MYGWLWRSLPGRPGVRAGWMLLLVLIAVAALWFGVFPLAAAARPRGRQLDQQRLSPSRCGPTLRAAG